MKPIGKLIIIGGAVDKGSFTESNFESQVENNLNFFEKGILIPDKNKVNNIDQKRTHK